MSRVKDLLNYKNWLNDAKDDSDIVISSRIRLARNMQRNVFTQMASDTQLKEIEEEVLKISAKTLSFKKAIRFDVNMLDEKEKHFLVERHIISKAFAEEEGQRTILVGEGERLNLMINEEDHLRMSALLPGFQISRCWDMIDTLDDELSEGIDYAFSEEWGYLTACPTNVGTGMRASVMMHLPCLVMLNQTEKIFEAIAKLGLTVRGLYGEGSASSGNIFQISNQVTLGVSEEDIIDKLNRIIQQIIDHELNSRNKIVKTDKVQIEDKIFRAYGTLRNARIISYSETIQLLSLLWLGQGLKLLDIDKKKINELFLLTQPCHIQVKHDKNLAPIERDIKRAELIRQLIN